MLETLEAVFTRGRLFHRLLLPASATTTAAAEVATDEPLPRINAAVTGARDAIGCITEKVLRNLRKKYVFYAGGLPVLV